MKPKNRTSRESFVFANALVNNHLPKAISTQAYVDKFGEIAEVKLGLWDAAIPDYSTYYPDITEEDLNPKEEDFYSPVVRALSKIILNKYGPIDFSEGNVLRDSTNLLVRQSMYANHEVLVGNEVGVVREAVFQQAFQDQNGNTIPAGINVRPIIDGKSNPRLVRGMRMDPPAVHSFSVGVTFDWEKSHPKMDESDFWRALGTYGKDGKLVRRIVSDIQAYHELSIVPHGADPYAQVISKKGINNVDYAKRMLRFPSKNAEVSNTFHFIEKDFIQLGHYTDYIKASENTIPKINKLNNDNYNSMDLIEFLNSLGQMKALNLSGDISPEAALTAVENAVTALTTVEASNQTLTEENTRLQGELDTANASLKDEKPKVEAYELVLKATKEEAARLYKLSKGDKASTEMIEMIANSGSYQAALTFLNQFKKDTEDQFSGKCSDCGSTNVTRMSSVSGNEGVIDPSESQENLDNPTTTTPKSTEEVFSNLRKSKTSGNAESIHGVTIQ